MRDILSDLDQPGEAESDPVRAAQSAMRPELPKRFYESVSVEKGPEGFSVLLDGRPVRTPARGNFVLPSQALAEAVAAEWEAQATHVDPAAMPLTRMINTALDGVVHTKEEVRAEILGFAGSDLVCYRAGSPDRLVKLQAGHWDPFLRWMEADHNVRFILAEGVMHVDQPEETLSAVAGLVAAQDSALALTALHVVTGLTGSAVMALALVYGRADPESVWQAAHVDEDWNVAQWGEDAEAARRRAARKQEFDAAVAILRSVSGN